MERKNAIQISFSVINDLNRAKSPVIVCFLFKGERIPPYLEKEFPYLAEFVKEEESRGTFKGEMGQKLVIPAWNERQARFQRIILFGLDEMIKFQPQLFYQQVGEAIKIVRDMKFDSCAFALNNVKLASECATWNIARGVKIGLYHYSQKTDGTKLPLEFRHVEIWTGNQPACGILKGIIIGDAVNFSRWLSDTPSNIATPSWIAGQTEKLFKDYTRIRVDVLSENSMEILGMNCIIAVGKGSKNPPKLLVIRYNGSEPDEKPIALVGKGITFDSGGINIKPGEGMDEMKFDMTGAANVIGAIKAVAEMQLVINIIGIVPLAENMPSGNSYQPGNIIKSYSGKTVKIYNTDAEGRLLLIDAIEYAQKDCGAETIIDMATLTGACVVALGHHFIGLFHNSEDLKSKILSAAKESGEPVWELPLTPEFSKEVKGDITDIKNVGKSGKWGGASAAAAFLKTVVKENVKWAHLDIAGVDNDQVGRPWLDKNQATGIGVALLVEFLKNSQK